jgi:hypothetical protein
VTFIDRVGASVVAPRRAFAEADAGRGGTGDAALLLVLAFVCAELPSLVQAGWTGLVVGFGPALQTLLSRLARFAGGALIVWAAAGIAITLAAGRRRSPSKDFDLAGVAFVPYLVVKLVATWVPAPPAVEDGVAVGVAALWVVAAVLYARRARAT